MKFLVHADLNQDDYGTSYYLFKICDTEKEAFDFIKGYNARADKFEEDNKDKYKEIEDIWAEADEAQTQIQELYAQDKDKEAEPLEKKYYDICNKARNLEDNLSTLAEQNDLAVMEDASNDSWELFKFKGDILNKPEEFWRFYVDVFEENGPKCLCSYSE